MGKKMNAGIASASMACAAVGICLAPSAAATEYEYESGKKVVYNEWRSPSVEFAESGVVNSRAADRIVSPGMFVPRGADDPTVFCPGTIVEAWEFGPVPGKGMSPCADD